MSAETTLSNEAETVANKQLLKKAVLENKATTKRGFQERMFTWAFSGFVYPQIWEDPEVDIPAMKIDETTRIMTICSGGCNMMNYLTENPASVTAVDLNPHHVALGRLKIAAVKHLPDYESFFLFFGCADSPKNIEKFDRYIAPNLDKYTYAYWNKWVFPHGRRINLFSSRRTCINTACLVNLSAWFIWLPKYMDKTRVTCLKRAPWRSKRRFSTKHSVRFSIRNLCA